MDLSAFTANYAHLSDDELLCLWADRSTLVPEALAALESELQRRGLRKEDAARVKKRLDELAAREAKGPLVKQVEAAKYERNMRRFVGWEEPEFYSPHYSRDTGRPVAYLRHKYRVWKAFRDHTGRWPVFSIWFHFLSWIVVFGFTVAAIFWVDERKWGGPWSIVAVSAWFLLLASARDFGARQVRKLDWKRYGT